jgi:hypothetical protein
MSLPQYKCVVTSTGSIKFYSEKNHKRTSTTLINLTTFRPLVRTGASGVVSIRVYKGKALTAPGVEYKSVLAHPGSKARKVRHTCPKGAFPMQQRPQPPFRCSKCLIVPPPLSKRSSSAR